jgi:hypothetical protein
VVVKNGKRRFAEFTIRSKLTKSCSAKKSASSAFHRYVVTNLTLAIIIYPITKLAKIIIAKLTGFITFLINFTEITIKAIRGFTS